MEDRKYNVKLFLYDEPELDRDIEFYQNDTNTCIMNISLFKDRSTKYLVDGTVSILINKPDGTEVVDMLMKLNDGEYIYELPNSAINVVGNHTVTVQCTGSNNDRTTFMSFKYKIKSVARSEDIYSENEYPILTKLLSDNYTLNKQVNVAEALRGSNEETRKSNETLRQENFDKAIKEYESYKNVMIAESNVAALQNQINAGNAQLAEIATIIDFVKLENETWDKAINRVINAGNKIKFLNKQYELYDTIILKNNTVLELHEETELIRKHDKQMFISEFNVNTVKYEGTNNIHIKGGTITHNGNETPRNMFLLFHARNIKFKNVTFKNIVSTHAIDLVGCENVEILSCKFLGYDHSKSTKKFREVIQIDVAGQTGAGLDIDKYPNTSLCFDGTRTRNVTIKNCLFDKSETLPPPHNCIGTHSQVEKPLNGDNRSNNIRILNNTFIGNGIITISKDDGNITKAGKCIRLIQMSDVTIEGNIIKNYGIAVSCEIFATYRALNGEVVTDEEKVKEQNIGNVNVTIINNTIECPDVEESYKCNCISIDSQITTAFHHNFKINGNNIKNNGVNDNRSIGIRNLNTCLSTYNNIDGGGKGYYIEIDTSKDIITRDNNYKNVTVPVDFVGAYTEGSGECLALLEDGTNRKYLIYVPNSVENISQKPSIRIKSVESGNFSDLVIKQKPEWINATYNEGVSAYSSSVKCKFAKDDFGFVHLEGACTHQANQSNLTLFTLPEGYRPTMNLAFVTVASGSSGKATNRIKVNTNGTVVLESTDSESSTPYTNLNGIIFST